MIVGEIKLGEDGKPFFTILRHHETPEANVRPCGHHKFTLDQKWSTVTCNDCGERIDPFAALLYFCQRWEDFEQKRRNWIEAEKRVLIESLRSLKRLRAATDDERSQIDALLRRRWSVTIEEVRELERSLDRTIRDRKYERKARATQTAVLDKHIEP